MTDETLNDVIQRWNRRFNRSMAVYNENFAEEGFEDLSVTLVAGASVEALLWIGIQFAGYQPTGPKQVPLEFLLDEASKRGVIDGTQLGRLRAFKTIRNAYAHDIDYRIAEPDVSRLRRMLPVSSKQMVKKAEANILPEPSLGVRYRLFLGQIVALTSAAIGEAWKKYDDTERHGSAD